jgi:hypothetical protein
MTDDSLALLYAQSSMPCYDWLCLDPVMDVPVSSGYTDWEWVRALDGFQVLFENL